MAKSFRSFEPIGIPTPPEEILAPIQKVLADFREIPTNNAHLTIKLLDPAIIIPYVCWYLSVIDQSTFSGLNWASIRPPAYAGNMSVLYNFREVASNDDHTGVKLLGDHALTKTEYAKAREFLTLYPQYSHSMYILGCAIRSYGQSLETLTMDHLTKHTEPDAQICNEKIFKASINIIANAVGLSTIEEFLPVIADGLRQQYKLSEIVARCFRKPTSPFYSHDGYTPYQCPFNRTAASLLTTRLERGDDGKIRPNGQEWGGALFFICRDVLPRVRSSRAQYPIHDAV